MAINLGQQFLYISHDACYKFSQALIATLHLCGRPMLQALHKIYRTPWQEVFLQGHCQMFALPSTDFSPVCTTLYRIGWVLQPMSFYFSYIPELPTRVNNVLVLTELIFMLIMVLAHIYMAVNRVRYGDVGILISVWQGMRKVVLPLSTLIVGTYLNGHSLNLSN